MSTRSYFPPPIPQCLYQQRIHRRMHALGLHSALCASGHPPGHLLRDGHAMLRGLACFVFVLVVIPYTMKGGVRDREGGGKSPAMTRCRKVSQRALAP